MYWTREDGAVSCEVKGYWQLRNEHFMILQASFRRYLIMALRTSCLQIDEVLSTPHISLDLRASVQRCT